MSEPDDQACTISAVAHEGLAVVMADGSRGHLAVVDANGNLIASGSGIEAAVWDAAIHAYRNFLMGMGHLRELRQPKADSGTKAA